MAYYNHLVSINTIHKVEDSAATLQRHFYNSPSSDSQLIYAVPSFRWPV